MKFLKLLPIIFMLALSLVSCDFGGEEEHACEFGAWEINKAPTCTEPGERARYCQTLLCFEYESEPIAPLGHTEQVLEGVAPSCKATGLTEGRVCAECGTVTVAQNVIPKSAHTEQVIPSGINKTEGLWCTVCLEILEAPEWIFTSSYENPDSYDGDYGYNYLATLPNGEGMQALYLAFDSAADAFHPGGTVIKDNVVAEIDYSEYSISQDEALTVWGIYRKDRPLYYWIDGTVTYTSSVIKLLCEDSYITPASREMCNIEIYSFVKRCMEKTMSSSIYERALGMHDEIIFSTDYAYEDDGVTPEDSFWAHNILGVVLKNEGVCEAYAKAFQLLLNFSEIENVFVTGLAGGQNHAWNLAKMDDGEWYWFDLTWDDTPEIRLGASYGYFCADEMKDVNYQEGYITTPKTFLQTHTPDIGGAYGIEHCYPLPKRASGPFSSSGIPVFDSVIEVDGAKYKISGYKTLTLIKAPEVVSYSVPSTVTYNLEKYTVSYIHSHNGEPVFSECTEALELSSTLCLINEVTLSRFSEVTLSDDNPYFEEINGAIYDENITILYFLNDKSLEIYEIPATLEEIYAPSYLFSDFDNLRGFSLDYANTSFYVYDGILYNADGTEFIWIPKALEGEVRIISGIKEIGLNESRGAVFAGCNGITEIYLPLGIKRLGSYSFAYISGLTVYFEGSEEMWQSVYKDPEWNLGASFNVVCIG